MIWAFLFGIALGLISPRARMYAQVCDHFIKAMRRKEKRIYKLIIEKNRLRKELESRPKN